MPKKKYTLKAETGYFNANVGPGKKLSELENIRIVVKAARFDDYIDVRVGHRHGWAYAAKKLLAEVERLEKELRHE